MSTLSLARERSDERRRIARALEAEGRRLWRLQNGDLSGWPSSAARLMILLMAAQQAAASGADEYVDAVLDEPEAAGTVAAAAFVGVASDGRPLDSLLRQPEIATRVALSQGATPTKAFAVGESSLRMILRTQVADAGRVADQVAITARPKTGYVRMLVGKTCSRCAILAGKYYRYNAGFRRHPRCFPAGVVVSGPASEAATRRWFEGEVVVLTTASGQQLTVTGNHPVLTRRGWVPANLLDEGDEVVRSTRPEGATPLVVPHHHQVPSLIEDVWGALGVGGLDRVPSSAEDFHGDGQGGEVDVVYADRALRGGVDASLGEEFAKAGLAGGLRLAGEFVDEGAPVLVDLRDAALSSGAVGGGGLGLPLSGGHLCGAYEPGFAGVAALDASVFESGGDNVAAHAVLLAERVLAGTSEIGVDDLVNGQVSRLARWDAPGDAFSVESAEGYASRGRDLLDRLAGQVELDRVVELRRVDWSGHVYSLTSVEGWHSANSLIVSNCDCIHVPAQGEQAARSEGLISDPKEYFDSLSEAEQNRIFTNSGAQAIRDGADMGQIVNVRRGAAGLTPAGARITADEARLLRGGRERGRLETRRVFGQDVFISTEGTTTRGIAGNRLGARSTGVKRGKDRYRRAKAPRLMPESIYDVATSREHAIELLRKFGYLL